MSGARSHPRGQRARQEAGPPSSHWGALSHPRPRAEELPLPRGDTQGPGPAAAARPAALTLSRGRGTPGHHGVKGCCVLCSLVAVSVLLPHPHQSPAALFWMFPPAIPGSSGPFCMQMDEVQQGLGRKMTTARSRQTDRQTRRGWVLQETPGCWRGFSEGGLGAPDLDLLLWAREVCRLLGSPASSGTRAEPRGARPAWPLGPPGGGPGAPQEELFPPPHGLPSGSPFLLVGGGRALFCFVLII